MDGGGENGRVDPSESGEAATGTFKFEIEKRDFDRRKTFGVL